MKKSFTDKAYGFTVIQLLVVVILTAVVVLLLLPLQEVPMAALLLAVQVVHQGVAGEVALAAVLQAQVLEPSSQENLLVVAAVGMVHA